MKPLKLPSSSKAVSKALLLMGVLALTSCTERIETELAEYTTPKLVVEGWITDQPQPQRVRLTMSAGYMSGQAAPTVSDAQVTISDGQQTFPLTEQPLGSGNYYTAADVAGSPGNLYTLTVVSGGKTYTSSDLMRPVAPIEDLAFEYDDDIEYEDGELPRYKVLVWTQDLAGPGDHYRWTSFVNDVPEIDSLKNIWFVEDLLFEGADVNGVQVGTVRATPGDNVRVQQWSISAGAFDVMKGIMEQTEWRGGLFDPPPANVPSNISNGALGFFGAASVKERTGVIPY